MAYNRPFLFTIGVNFGIIRTMDDDIQSKKEKSVDDLIKMSQGGKKKAHISSDEVEEKLKTKIREIDEKRKEEAALREAEDAG